MTGRNFDSIIFDLDGTLWDASSSTAVAWGRVAKKFQLEVSIDDAKIKNVSGLPFESCVVILFGTHVKTIPNLQESLDRAEQDEIIQSGGKLYEGAANTLRQLSKEYKIYLVSNCQKWYLDTFLDKSELKHVFTDTLCYGQTNQTKCENIKEIVKRNNINKAIYVGDTHWDQEAAYYAGVKFIFARYGFGTVNVHCPVIDCPNDLIALMASTNVVPNVKIRRLKNDEFNSAAAFYKLEGYAQAIQKHDRYYAAFYKDNIIGLVRLAFENSTYVLRGMRIKPKFQLFGIGTKLIKLLEEDIGSSESYCIPHGWLDNFYGQIGFKTIRSKPEAPEFLNERLVENQKKYPQLILMKRVGAIKK